MENNVRILDGDKIANQEFTRENFERLLNEVERLGIEAHRSTNEARHFRKKCLALYKRLEEEEIEIEEDLIHLKVAM